MSNGSAGRDALLGFLRGTKGQAEKGAFDQEKAKSEWVRDVKELIDRLESFLAAAKSEHLLEVTRGEETIGEEKLGNYAVPVLRILAPNGRTVEVLPRARYVVGGEGRVDLGSGPKTAMLVRTSPKAWTFQWRTSGPKGWTSAPLDEDTFSDAILNLLT